MEDKSRYKYIGDVERLWPRRLLDIVSMTSFERQSGNVYADVHEPKYSILSYTWGRFALPGKDTLSTAAHLPVQGVQWGIPAIDPRYFTADQFLRAIHAIRDISGNRFLWLDIACIDQKIKKIKMEEVGRQAGIFANADMAFIWLWTTTADKLRHSLVDILESRHIPAPFDASVSDLEADSRLKTLEEVVATVLDDWWFSSLWTLQEHQLRPDAVLLSRDGEPVDRPESFRTSSSELYYSLLSLDPAFGLAVDSLKEGVFGNERLRATAERLERRMKQAGYDIRPSINRNPNVHFALAHQRTATFELDRIYGIMALYNIQVGATVPGSDTAHTYTLEELEDEFALALNAKSPFLAQWFIHVDKPSPRKTWKITQTVRISQLCQWDQGYSSYDDCVIRAEGSEVRIRAGITSFEGLVEFWRTRMTYLPEGESSGGQLIVVVDDYICGENPDIPYFDYEPGEAPEKTFQRTQRTVDGLLSTFTNSRLSVIRMGKLEWNSWSLINIFGLLILHDEEDKTRCQRMGLCRWEGDIWDLPAEVEALRPQFEHRYHGTIH